MSGFNYKVLLSFDLKAAGGKHPKDPLYGVVRLNAADGITKVIGLSGFLETDARKQQAYLYDKALFFYGTIDDLIRNYRQDLPASLQLEQYRDRYHQRIYGEPASNKTTIPDSRNGFYLIPVKHMGLSSAQRTFIQNRVIPATKNRIIFTLERLLKHTKGQEKGFRYELSTSFRFMPEELKKEVEKQGSYFKPVWREKVATRRQIVSFQGVRIVETSLNTFPSWIQAYL